MRTCESRLHVARHALAATAVLLAGCRANDWQTAVDHVIQAERAFAARASDTTVQQAFIESIATNAILFRPGPTDGHGALAAQPYPSDLLLEWAPEWADASLDGEFGYTTGPWTAGRRNDAAAPRAHGVYVTIWRRQADRVWRAILDMGTAGADPADATTVHTPARPPSRLDAADSVALARSIHMVDEDFVEAAAADSAALAAFVSDETRFLRDGSLPAIGAVSANRAYTVTERSALWTRSGFGVSRVGDLGFVFGTWSSPARDSATGAWLRIWRRDAAGDWKLALDAVTGSRSTSIS